MIPERQPIGDSFQGVVLKADDACLLASGLLGALEVAASGTLMLRYAVQYLGKPHLSIVPGLVALDYGDMLTAEPAWDFLLHHSNLHPRADVLGYRNDGVDDMIVVKLLDLAAPIQVLAYANEADIIPITPLTAIIAPDDTNLPARLLEYLPRFTSIEDWQAAHHE